MTHQPSKVFRTTVVAVRPLSPHLTRVTLGAPDLRHFAPDGFDQRIKLLLPRRDGTLPEIGLFEEPPLATSEWYRRWRALPDEERNPMRTYTVRAVRPQLAQIDIDFVLHGDTGPASSWAMRAQPGDELVVVGPDVRSGVRGGIEWAPGSARSVLLAGDETAVPAICAILEQLDETFSGHAYLEVPDVADALPVVTASRVEVHWLARGHLPHGALLDEAVALWGREREAPALALTGAAVAGGAGWSATGGTAGASGGRAVAAQVEDHAEDGIVWEVPAPDVARERVAGAPSYAWLAGEAGTIAALRRYLVNGLGIDRRSVAFMGYWRRGRAEGA